MGKVMLMAWFTISNIICAINQIFLFVFIFLRGT